MGFCNICTRTDFHLKLLIENVPIFTMISHFPVGWGERMDV